MNLKGPFLGAFFLSKKEIPAKPWGLINFSFLTFFSFIPPKEISLIKVAFFNLRYLQILNCLFVLSLNKGDRKISFTF